jgi:DNA-binding transcriptional LysR family regulator
MKRSKTGGEMTVRPLCEVRIGWIEAFLDAAMVRSFSKAAAFRNLKEDNIRKPVKQLEDWLGKRLFLREGRKLTLTPDGSAFHSKAHLMLEVLFDFRERVSFDVLADMNAASLETLVLVGRKRSGREDVVEID